MPLSTVWNVSNVKIDSALQKAGRFRRNNMKQNKNPTYHKLHLVSDVLIFAISVYSIPLCKHRISKEIIYTNKWKRNIFTHIAPQSRQYPWIFNESFLNISRLKHSLSQGHWRLFWGFTVQTEHGRQIAMVSILWKFYSKKSLTYRHLSICETFRPTNYAWSHSQNTDQ